MLKDTIGKHGLEFWVLQVAGSNPAAPTIVTGLAFDS